MLPADEYGVGHWCGRCSTLTNKRVVGAGVTYANPHWLTKSDRLRELESSLELWHQPSIGFSSQRTS